MKKAGDRILLGNEQLDLTIKRLSHQLLENHDDFDNTVLIGLQPRGTLLAQRIHDYLTDFTGNSSLKLGFLDVSFYRDDFRRRDAPIEVSETKLSFEIENKTVILIDDVLYTGRTVRAGLDALMDYGRPEKVEFVALIDRRFSRQLPIQANYIGRTVDAVINERVDVILEGKSRVILKNLPDEQ